MELINVMASSLDGKIGAHRDEGDTERILLGLSSDADREFLRAEVSRADAIIVGSTSIRANGSCLDWLGMHGAPPHWYILTQTEIAENLLFWQQTQISRTLVTKNSYANLKGGVANLVYGSSDPASFLYKKVQDAGFRRVLLFGGGLVNQMFYQKKLVDRLHLSISPLILGSSSAPSLIAGEKNAVIRLSLVTSHTKENFVFLYYKVAKLPGGD